MTAVSAVPLAEFEARLREVLRSKVEFIEVIGEDLVAAGGKRVRPAITYLASKALSGGEQHPFDTDLAVCVELLHSASLLHDDLIDDSDTRRGQETAFRKFGNVVSVMSGDFMLSRLLVLLAEMPPSLTRAFGLAASAVCEGEVLQFQVAAYADYSLDNYLQVIYGKTAAVFELAARAPALLRSAQGHLTEALETYGREYGLAFQMQDDLLDLMGDEATIGKPVGGDLREGKATLPVLYLLEGGSADEVRRILERRAAQTGDVERVRELVAAQGIYQRARDEIVRRAELAIAALHRLPPSPDRDRLEAYAAYEVQRVR
ncbi:polyprenyl synthetase family protein [Deinococcus detaillensis]|uniref:Polyprenyl synthetase family protein n=1 Tax=Deinococcus detaillensis TaxID=2592048 RepID=A0A553V2N9_9DEIO|nr:polyprenyl synthetase family protein [Deinococcus detaillensis]TSA86726.1 polyprenyl synthetase family protein [Deinococcus detaillensis]